jgi:hypothetical protein
MTALFFVLLATLIAATIWSTDGAVDTVELLKQLSKAAGIYSDPSRSSDVVKMGLEKTVMVTGCNYGFLNHLHNFKCFADRLGMKFLVISFDQQAHDYITKNTTMTSYLMSAGSAGQEVTNVAQEFRSKQFNLITARKKEAVHDILALGYNVLFSDTDVAMIQDPLPDLLFQNVDYVHSLNYWCTLGEKPFNFYKSRLEGNTGFYFVRSNNNTVKLWQAAYEAAPKHPRLDDQAVFWKVIRASVSPPILPIGECRHFNRPGDLRLKPAAGTSVDEKYLVTCDLNTCKFSSGMLSRQYVPELTYETLILNLRRMNAGVITMHGNYISGNRRKMERMKEYGFWLASADTVSIADGAYAGKCLDYVPAPLNTTAVPKSQ